MEPNNKLIESMMGYEPVHPIQKKENHIPLEASSEQKRSRGQ